MYKTYTKRPLSYFIVTLHIILVDLVYVRRDNWNTFSLLEKFNKSVACVVLTGDCLGHNAVRFSSWVAVA